MVPIASRAEAAVLAAVVGLSCPMASAGVIQPVSQQREVFGDAYAEDASGSVEDGGFEEAVDFAPFVEAAHGSATLDGGLGSGGGSQSSTISGVAVSVSGACFATAEVWEFDTSANGAGRSLFDFTFELGEEATFTIDGMLAAYDSGGVTFSFTGPAGDVVDVLEPSNDEVSFTESGVLAPGQYRLYALTTGSAYGDGGFSDYAFGEFSFDFEIDGSAVPGDVDGDGAVGFADLLEVLSAWGDCPGAGACPADVDGDGVVGFGDVLLVLSNWS